MDTLKDGMQVIARGLFSSTVTEEVAPKKDKKKKDKKKKKKKDKKHSGDDSSGSGSGSEHSHHSEGGGDFLVGVLTGAAIAHVAHEAEEDAQEHAEALA